MVPLSVTEHRPAVGARLGAERSTPGGAGNGTQGVGIAAPVSPR